ncbi:hypothetical protein Glove_320g3 [Diversispora epigaea]|uniref:Uncharacterized protein n=1 Tax=Diversispora epigaea TaxID=1348612 RepID=A0A397HNT2_9GLOM|nr:hypothetical protein Glove_320g3 [Diversispora epigaea]
MTRFQQAFRSQKELLQKLAIPTTNNMIIYDIIKNRITTSCHKEERGEKEERKFKAKEATVVEEEMAVEEERCCCWCWETEYQYFLEHHFNYRDQNFPECWISTTEKMFMCYWEERRRRQLGGS